MALLRLSHWPTGLRLLYRQLRKRLLQVNRQQIQVRPLARNQITTLDRKGPAAAGRTYADEWAEQEAGRLSVFVAWHGRRPLAVGFVHWPGPRQKKVQEVYPGCPEIYRMHVQPRYRSMGLGSLLIEACEQEAKVRGHQRIGLGVTYKNRAAFELYRRLGYGEPQPSNFLDEFDSTDFEGHLVHHSIEAHFLVKQL